MEYGSRMALAANQSGVLSAEYWSDLRAIFFQAIEMDPASREEFIRRRCANPELLNVLRALLAAHETPGGILDHGPPVPVGAELPPVLRPGSVLSGRYLIDRLVQRGGMGEVYQARDLRQAGAILAVKTLRHEVPGDAQTIARFKRETRLARRISHPNVCRVFSLLRDKALEPPLLYLTMEFLDGITVAQRIGDRGAFGAAEAMRIGREIASGLAAAHSIGILHRDFKPSNVILVKEAAGRRRAVITDFGLARRRGDDELTLTGQPMGTMSYMSPEQIEGSYADSRSDVWALGLVLWELFTGKRPIPGEASPRLQSPRMKKSWESLILRCVERDPARRYLDAGEVCAAIEEADRPKQQPLKSMTASSFSAQ
jgi:serine/threonine protein kinase